MTALSFFLAFFQLTGFQLPKAEVIDTSDGLSNSIVYDIHKDSEGYIWFATDNGLNRYDGYQFQVYYNNQADSSSISSNIVRSIEEDDQGNLWVGTFNGLNRFDKATETFDHFLAFPDSSTSRLDLQDIVLDQKGRIWFNNLENSGWFDLQTERFTFFETDERPYDMAVNVEGEVWLRTIEGTLYIFDEDSKQLVKLDQNRDQPISFIHYGQETGKLWLPTQLKNHEETTLALPSFSEKFETFVALEPDSLHLLLGTEKGLYLYNRLNKDVEKIALGEATSVLAESVKSIYKDDTGAIWVGTLNGVFHFNPFKKPFEHLDLIEGQSDVIMGMALYEQSILANTLGQGLVSIDVSTNAFSPLDFRGTPPTGHRYVWNMEIVPDTDYPVWLATNAGLLLYQPESRNWRAIDLPVHNPNAPAVFAITKMSSELYLVSDVHQVHVLSASGQYLQTIKGLPVIKAIIQDLVTVENLMYVATDSGILAVVDLNQGSSQPLSALNQKAAVLQNVPIWDLELIDETLWIGTNQGLYHYDLQTHDFEKAPLNTNGKNDIIFSISPDGQNQFWLGTEAGIIRYHSTEETAKRFDAKDGLVNYEYNRKSAIMDTNGHLWLGGVNGITRFDPGQIKEIGKSVV